VVSWGKRKRKTPPPVVLHRATVAPAPGETAADTLARARRILTQWETEALRTERLGRIRKVTATLSPATGEPNTYRLLVAVQP